MKIINFSDVNESIVFFDVYGLNQKWNKKSTFSYLSSARPNHGFMCVLCNEIIFEYSDGTKESYGFGNLLYIPKGLNYKVTFSDENESFNTLLINFSIQEEVKFSDRAELLVSSASAKYTDEFYKIISYYRNTKNNYYAVMTSFFSLLDNISRHIGKKNITSPEYKIIEPAMEYIDYHINERLNVSELAKMCLVSESCFRKKFKKYVGKSPSEYIINVKMEKAEQMLKSPEIPINVIASELGFYDCSYFYKMFVRKNNITPLVFRQNYIT